MGLFDIFGGGGDFIMVDDPFGRPMTTTSSPIFPSTSSLNLTSNITGGEVVVIGGVIAAIVAVAKWLFDDKVDEAKTEGVKEGYEKASREYEAKLRKQAEAFRNQLEALKEDIESLKKQRDKAMKLVEEAGKLLGEFEGCIGGLKKQGITPDDKTMKDYKYLSDFIQQLKDAKAA